MTCCKNIITLAGHLQEIFFVPLHVCFFPLPNKWYKKVPKEFTLLTRCCTLLFLQTRFLMNCEYFDWRSWSQLYLSLLSLISNTVFFQSYTQVYPSFTSSICKIFSRRQEDTYYGEEEMRSWLQVDTERSHNVTWESGLSTTQWFIMLRSSGWDQSKSRWSIQKMIKWSVKTLEWSVTLNTCTCYLSR